MSRPETGDTTSRKHGAAQRSGVAQQIERCLHDLSGADASARERAVHSLGSLAMKPSHARAMLEAGCIEPLVGALDNTDSQRCMEGAVKALNSLIFCDQACREHILQAGGVQGLSRTLELGSPQLGEAVLRMLAELASVGDEDSPLRLAHPANSALQSLIGALGADTEEMQLLAAAALSDVAPHVWARMPESAGDAGDALLAILQSAKGQATSDQAAWTLWGLASTHDVSEKLLSGVKSIVMLLESDSQRAKEAGCWLTWALSSNSEHVGAVMDAGGVPALMRVLARGNMAAQEAAAWAVWAVADADRSAAKEFLEAGAAEALRELVGTGSPSAKEGATGALTSLNSLRRNVRAFADFIVSHSPMKGRSSSPGRSPKFSSTDPAATPGMRIPESTASPASSGHADGSALLTRMQWGALHSPGRRGRMANRSSPSASPLARAILTPKSRLSKSRLGDVTSPVAVRLLGAATGMAEAVSSVEMQDNANVMQNIIASRVAPNQDDEACSKVHSHQLTSVFPEDLDAAIPQPVGRTHRLQESEALPNSSSIHTVQPDQAVPATKHDLGRSQSHPTALLKAIKEASQPDKVHMAVAEFKQAIECRDPEVLQSLCSMGAADLLVYVIENPEWLPITHRTAAEALGILCSSCEVDSIMYSKSALSNLITQILRPGKHELQQPHLNKSSNVLDGAGSGADAAFLGSVVQSVLEGATRSERIKAATTLGNLCMQPDNRRLVLAKRAVPALVRMLKTGSLASKAAAATALRNVAIDTEGQMAIAASDGLSPLCSLVGVEDADCCTAAAATLVNLTANFSLGTKIIAAGALPVLITATLPGEVRGRRAPKGLRASAAEALQNIGANSAAHQAMAGTGTVSNLIEALKVCQDACVSSALLRTLGNLAASNTLRAEAASAGALPIALARLRCSETCVAAAASFRNLSVGNAAALSAIPELVNMLGRAPLEAATAARALWNVAASEQGCKAVVAAKALRPLLTLARLGSSDSAEAAIGVLANLAGGSSGDVASALLRVKVVPVAVELLSGPNAAAAEQAARCLRGLLARGPPPSPVLDEVAAAGGLQALLGVLDASNTAATAASRELAVCCLYSFLARSDQRTAFLKAGGAQLLLNAALARPGASMTLREMGLTTLRAALPKPEYREALAGSPPALSGLAVVMLRSRGHGQEVAAYTSWDLLLSAPSAFGKVGAKKALLQAGVLEGLKAVMDDGAGATTNAKTAAAGALKELTGSDEALDETTGLLLAQLSRSETGAAREGAARSLAALTHHDMRAVGAVGMCGGACILLEALSFGAGGPGTSSTPHLREAAARCLWNLCHDGEIAATVTRQGGVAVLLNLLAASEPRVAQAAAGAMGALCATSLPARLAAGPAGGIELLVQLLAEASPSPQGHFTAVAAAGALRNLSASAENARKVSAVGGVSALIHAIPVAGKAALQALANLAAVEQIGLEVADAGGVQAALRSLDSEPLGESAARLTRVLASLPRLRACMVTSGAVRALLEALRKSSKSNAGLASEAARALRLLSASGEMSKAAIVDDSGLPLLVWLAKGSRGVGPAGDAAYALWNICYRHEERRRAVAAAGGMMALINLLKSAAGGTMGQRGAAGALADLAGSPELRGKLLRAGAVPALLRLLDGGDSPGQEEAGWALTSLALVPEGRTEILRQGGVQVLVRSLGSVGSGPAAKEAAAWAIATLAVQASNRQIIIAAGALPGLHRLSKDPVRTTREAAIAAHEILNGRGNSVRVSRPNQSAAADAAACASNSGVPQPNSDSRLVRQLFAEEGAGDSLANVDHGTKTSMGKTNASAPHSQTVGCRQNMSSKPSSGLWRQLLSRHVPSAKAAPEMTTGAATGIAVPHGRTPRMYTVSTETPPAPRMTVPAA